MVLCSGTSSLARDLFSLSMILMTMILKTIIWPKDLNPFTLFDTLNFGILILRHVGQNFDIVLQVKI